MRFFSLFRSVMFLVGLLWAASGLLACTNPTPHVTAAALGTVVQAGKVRDPKTTFATADRMIHLVVEVGNAIQNTNVGAKWYAVDSGKRLLFESESVLDAFNTSADFALTNTNDWIPGNYQVVIYINGNEERSLNFDVK